MADNEYENGTPAEIEPETDEPTAPAAPLAKVAEKIEQLSKAAAVPTVAAEKLGDVLPLSFYQGNSELVLTERETEILKGFRDAPDEDCEIRPEGLIYAPHMFYRNALSDVFGAGAWSLVPGSGIQLERNGDRIHIFQRWVLRIHGAYVGEAIGSGSYFSNNAAQDKSDAAEAAASNALMRICAKSSLGIGTNPWSRRFCREWKRKYAVQVWVRDFKGQVKRWRRKDDDPFTSNRADGVGAETGLVDTEKHVGPVSGATVENQNRDDSASTGRTVSAAKPASPPTPPAPKPGPKPVPKPTPKPSPKPAEKVPVPATSATEPKVGESELRYFISACRLKQLIRYNEETKSDDAGAAYAWLCEFLAVDPGEGTGKTVIERIRALYMAQSISTHRDKVVPALKALEVGQ